MQAFENHTHWTAVKEVCRRLKEAGHQALLAGGCVRDLLMNREPNDFDIATEADPDEVGRLFPQALTVGKAFGVTILPFEGFHLEVATFREDGPYVDGRRPSSVRFATAEEDAKRRDFTINALFYDLDSQTVIDYVGGEADIRRGVIRTVGEPELRFEEDKLRLFRAVRFSAQLHFEIEPRTLEVVTRLAPEIRVVSRERVRDELLKLLKSPGRVRGLELLLSTGLLKALFPDAAAVIVQNATSWLASFQALPADEKDPVVFLALFFLPRYLEQRTLIGAAEAERSVREAQLKNLRIENRQIEAILFCLRHLTQFRDPEGLRPGEMALLLAHPASRATEAVMGALDALSNPERQAERVRYLESLRQKSLVAGRLKPPPLLTGEDVKQAGGTAGPQMGRLLQEALLLQLEGILTDRESALNWLSQKIAKA